MRPGQRAISTSSKRQAMAFPTGTRARRGLRKTRRLSRSARRTHSTSTSRSTAPPRRSPRKGLLRLGNFLRPRASRSDAERYWQAGLTVANTLFAEPYLSTDENHQGLLLHSIYHRPNGWDYIPDDRRVPCGEASMWGDYHAREVALYLQRVLEEKPYLTFFGA